MNIVAYLRQRCKTAWAMNETDAGDRCKDVSHFVYTMSGGVNTNDARYFNWDIRDEINIPYKFFNEAARKLEFYNAINIGWSPNNPVFGGGNDGVREGLANN